jgi:hypothetical protein
MLSFSLNGIFFDFPHPSHINLLCNYIFFKQEAFRIANVCLPYIMIYRFSDPIENFDLIVTVNEKNSSPELDWKASYLIKFSNFFSIEKTKNDFTDSIVAEQILSTESQTNNTEKPFVTAHFHKFLNLGFNSIVTIKLNFRPQSNTLEIGVVKIAEEHLVINVTVFCYLF